MDFGSEKSVVLTTFPEYRVLVFVKIFRVDITNSVPVFSIPKLSFSKILNEISPVLFEKVAPFEQSYSVIFLILPILFWIVIAVFAFFIIKFRISC